VSGIHPIRPESLPGPDARLARELLHKPWGEGLAYLAAFCVFASLALLLLMPHLLDLRGGAFAVIHISAAACAVLAFFACIAAAFLLRHALTPAKILAWMVLPAAIFLICAGALSMARVRNAVESDKFVDAEGRFTITRPGADWVFLPVPILGEGSEVEMAHARGVPLHVSVRTGGAKDSVQAVLNEIFRLMRLPSLRAHHHGEEPPQEQRASAYRISSVEVVIGDEAASILRRMFDRAIAANGAVLDGKKSSLKSLRESDGSGEDIARLGDEVSNYERLLDWMKGRRDAGDLSEMLRYLAAEDLQQEVAFPVTVLWREIPPQLDGLNAARVTVRGTTAQGDEFFEVVQIVVKEGAVYVVDGFSPRRDQAGAVAAFDTVLAGFKFEESKKRLP
jgi:hypothetical protein